MESMSVSPGVYVLEDNDTHSIGWWGRHSHEALHSLVLCKI